MPFSMAKTYYASRLYLNKMLRGQDFVSPTALYVALYTSSPGKNGGGVEVTGGGYSRQPITFGPPTDTANGSVVSNSSDVNFGTATSDWGTIVAAAILDQSGNMLYYGALEVPRTIVSGDTAVFKAGDFRIEEQ